MMASKRNMTDRGHLNLFLAAQGRIRLLLAKRIEVRTEDEAIQREALALAQQSRAVWGKRAAGVLRAAADFIESGEQ